MLGILNPNPGAECAWRWYYDADYSLATAHLAVLHGGAQTFGDVPLRPGYALFWPGRTAEKVAESARACRP